MKFMSLLVAFCFSMNVFAATGSISALEQAVDEYQFALTVEWDQKDNKFLDAQTEVFFAKLQKLIKDEGLSQKEIMAFAESKMQDKDALAALKLKASLLAKANNTEELTKLVKEASKDFYAQGASWNGATVVPVVIGLVIVGVIGYAVWFSATHECVAYEEQYVCNSYNNCYGGGYYGGGYYGGGYYGGGYCYGGGYTTCGYADVCVEYAKKD